MISRIYNFINKIKYNIHVNRFRNSVYFKYIPIIIVAILFIYLILFNFLFRKYDVVVMVENNGYMIDGKSEIENLKTRNEKDKNVNNIKTVKVDEYNYIYKNLLNHYVDNNNNKKSVNFNYPLFINDGLSIVNYNDNTNLIDVNLNRIEAIPNIVLSYGSAYNINDSSPIDLEKYLLLSYENSIYINLYDVKIKTDTNEYSIPVNSFMYFLDDGINYYERIDDKFYKKEITDIDFSSIISFDFESRNEEYKFTYEDFLIGIGSLFKSEKFTPSVITDIDEQVEEISEEGIIDEELKENINKPGFAWVKPVVTASDLVANVYSISGLINIEDPAGVITKSPTFIVLINGKTYSRRSFYNSGPFSINGLSANTTFQVVGQYTYLAEDLQTKKVVTFYSNTFTTLSLDELDSIDINFENGDIFAKRIEINNLSIKSSLDSETIKGVKNISFTIKGENYYISKQKVNSLLKGEVLDVLSTSDSLNSNSEYDFEINFFDNNGNKLRVNNNKGHTRTSSKAPSVVLKLIKNEVDYVILGLDLKNDDNIHMYNYKYVVVNSAGKTIREGEVSSNQLRLSDLDPNQMFSITVSADFDLNDNKGLKKDVVIGQMDFTSLPITSLGLLIFNFNLDEVTDNMVIFSYEIDNNKTDARLLRLLKSLHVSLYEVDSGEITHEYDILDSDIANIKDYKKLTMQFRNLKSNTKYNIKISSSVMQGETVFELDSLHNLEIFETHKQPAKVEVTNSFTTSNMIDLDVRVKDIDGAVLSNGVRVELRDVTNNLIDSRIIGINEDFTRITYNNLKVNQNYFITFIADEYNETNNYSTFKAKYLLLKINNYTDEGISGSVELNSSLRVANGENLVDMNSETKWVQTYMYYTIPKTHDEEGDMHIYSKNGASNYMYDLSEYHNQVVTVTFKIKAVIPLNTGYKLYLNNYLGYTTSSAYGIELKDITTDKWTNVTYTFRVGSYKSGNHYILNNDKYYGKYRTDFIGFYFTNGSVNLADYEIRNFEVHIAKDMNELDLSDYTFEKGSYNNNGTPNDTQSYLTTRARLSEGLELEGGTVYSFDFNSDDWAYIYFTDLNNKYVSAYGWFQSQRAVYVPKNTKAYLIFRYGDGSYEINSSDINLKIYEYKDRGNIPYERFKYDFITKIKVNLIDSRNEISNDTYYIQVTNNKNQVLFVDEYKELENTDKIINRIKEIGLEENKYYNVNLLIKIRDRDYILDTFSISTNSEVKGISTTNDWAYMQPNGNYIVLNDIDFYDFNLQTLGWGYKYFYGIIDFQGYSASVYSTNTTFQKLGRIEKSGVLKNMVLNVHLVNGFNNNSIRGFVSANYGTIENVQIKVFDERDVKYNDTYLNTLVDVNYASGVIRNFTMKLETEVNLYTEVGLLTRYNYGTINNGYVYGKNVIISNENSGATERKVGLIQRYGGAQSSVSNIYVLNNMMFPNNFSYDKTGLVAFESYGDVKNIYTVGNTSNIDQTVGPVVGYVRSTANFNNIYYLSDYIYTTSNQTKITSLNLNDSSFQHSVLGDGFNIDEMVKLGYYPQVIFSSNKMPKQEYLDLPVYNDDTLIDIITMDVKEKTNNSAIVDFVIYNPNGDSINSIIISDLRTNVISQVYEDGKSYVEVEVNSPDAYVSRYVIRSISSKSYNGIVSVKNYNIGEKYLYVDFYREINSVNDWININKQLNQNYVIMKDLDFKSYANYYIDTFTGKINGNNHVLKNISIVSNRTGLITQMNGTLEDIYFENVVKSSDSTNSGLVGYSNQYGRFKNVHIKNMTIQVPIDRTADTLYVGGLVGNLYYSKVDNCSITDIKIVSSAHVTDINAGGLVGYSNGGVYNNVYAQDVDILITDSINTLGVGGLVGREASSVATISNSYSTGHIDNNGYRTGGIVGYTAGYIENSYSSVDISSDIDTIGGIAGYASTPSYITNNLFVGNIYSKVIGAVVGRIISNGVVDETNYALNTGLINGVLSDYTNGEQFITLDELRNINILTGDFSINLGSNYDYSKVNEGILPKLYYLDEKELLPNQKDNRIYTDMFEVENMIIDKHATDANIILYLKNPYHYNIDEIIIDDMDTTIIKNNQYNDSTVLELNVVPKKYYDSYRFSEIKYHIGNEEIQSFEKTVRIDMLFYKNLRTFEDWQSVSTTDAENYILLDDIDFTGKDYNTSVVFNRLETNSDNEYHTLSGMRLNVTKAGNNKGIISRVEASLKNINFNDIKIESSQTTGNNYINLITYAYGSMKNVSFTNIEINTPSKHRVAIIGQLLTTNVDNVTLDDVKVVGNSYVSGFAAYYENTDVKSISNIKANKLDIYGSSNYVGGIFTNFSTYLVDDLQLINNIEVTNSTINGPNATYVGGVAAYGSANHVVVSSSNINGNQYVGGAFGYSYDNYVHYVEVKSSTVTGSYRFIGGAVGNTRNLYDCLVEDTKVYGTKVDTYAVGGLIGYMNGYTIYRSVVKDSEVTNSGYDTGGFSGYMTGGTIHTSSIHNTTVSGSYNTGGMAGRLYAGSLTVVRVTESTINSTINYAGGLAGLFDNINDLSTFREANMRQAIVANTEISAPSYAGGFIGAKNYKLYNPQNDYELYFDGIVSTEDNSTAGIASGDHFNYELVNLGRVGFYEKSIVNGVSIDSLNEIVVNDNLIETKNLGYIYEDTGEIGINYTYSNATYTNLIKLETGNTYKIHADALNPAYSDIMRIRMYDIDQKYLGNISGTSAYIWNYFDDYFSLSNISDITFTPIKDCYISVQFLYEVKNDSVLRITSDRSDGLLKNKLLTALQLRNTILWNRYLSSDYQDFYYHTYFGFDSSYWDFTPLNNELTNISVSDESNNNHTGTANMTLIQEGGLFFDGKDDYVSIDNYIPSSDLTISTTFSSYANRSYQYIFSSRNSSSNNGVGIFVHGRTLYVMINGSVYSTGYAIPYFKEFNIVMTYANNKELKVYLDGELIYTKSNVNKTIAVASDAKSYIAYDPIYNTSSYRYMGLVKNLYVFDRALSEEEVKNNYNSAGLTDTTGAQIIYDFTTTKYPNVGYYPYHKWSTSDIPVNWQALSKLPEIDYSYETNHHGSKLFGTKKFNSQSIYKGLINNNYHIYSSGINTINIEFDKISSDLEFTYKIGDKSTNIKVDKRVYSLYYDYNSDIEFIIKTMSDEKTIKLTYEDLQKTISINDGKYYFIKDGNLYGNSELLLEKVNHIYNNLALTTDNKVYNINSSKLQETYYSDLVLANEIPLYKSIIGNSIVNTYYNFSEIITGDGIAYRDERIVLKDNKIYMYTPNNNIKNDLVIFNNYNNLEYQIALGVDNKIYSYKNEINIGNIFINKDIIEINYDFNSNDPIIIIRYSNDLVVVYNYYSGEKLFEYGSSYIPSLFEFISLSRSPNNILSHNESYVEVKKLKSRINRISDKQLLDILDDSSNNSINGDTIDSNDGVISGNSGSEYQVSINDISDNYLITYNSKINSYELYNINDILNTNNDNVVNVEYKIKSNSLLNSYFYSNNKVDEKVKNNRLLIILVIVSLIIINLVIFVYNFRKKVVHEK